MKYLYIITTKNDSAKKIERKLIIAESEKAPAFVYNILKDNVIQGKWSQIEYNGEVNDIETIKM